MIVDGGMGFRLTGLLLHNVGYRGLIFQYPFLTALQNVACHSHSSSGEGTPNALRQGVAGIRSSDNEGQALYFETGMVKGEPAGSNVPMHLLLLSLLPIDVAGLGVGV